AGSSETTSSMPAASSRSATSAIASFSSPVITMHRGTSHPYAGTVRQTDPVRVAESFVASRFPAALGVVLAGSAAAGTSTPTSDVDLLLLGSEEMFDGGASSLAATFEHEGRLVEVFAYTPESFRTWAERRSRSCAR